MMLPPFARAIGEVTATLDALGIGYCIGGSVATLVHGEPRNTQDVDIVVDLRREHVDRLVSMLTPTFFADAEALHAAIDHGSSHNVIHRDTGHKVDLFVLRRRHYSAVELGRARRQTIVDGIEAVVSSAEDCVLTKLEWFRRGDEVSDHQWRDVLGVLKVQRGKLDLSYLRQWATVLGVVDLLEKALQQAAYK
jgi:hypothetical protein